MISLNYIIIIVGIIKCLKNSGFLKKNKWNQFEPHIKKYIIEIKIKL